MGIKGMGGSAKRICLYGKWNDQKENRAGPRQAAIYKKYLKVCKN